MFVTCHILYGQEQKTDSCILAPLRMFLFARFFLFLLRKKNIEHLLEIEIDSQHNSFHWILTTDCWHSSLTFFKYTILAAYCYSAFVVRKIQFPENIIRFCTLFIYLDNWRKKNLFWKGKGERKAKIEHKKLSQVGNAANLLPFHPVILKLKILLQKVHCLWRFALIPNN